MSGHGASKNRDLSSSRRSLSDWRSLVVSLDLVGHPLLEQLALQGEHLLLLVGLGVVVAEQVQHTVHGQQGELVAQRVAGLRPPAWRRTPGTARCRRASTGRARRRRAGRRAPARPSGSSSRRSGRADPSTACAGRPSRRCRAAPSTVRRPDARSSCAITNRATLISSSSETSMPDSLDTSMLMFGLPPADGWAVADVTGLPAPEARRCARFDQTRAPRIWRRRRRCRRPAGGGPRRRW